MTFEVEVNGKTRVVSIEPITGAGAAGGRFRIVVDAHARDGETHAPAADRATYEVEARRTEQGVSLVYVEDRRGIDAVIVEQPGGEYLVQLSRVGIVVAVDGRRASRRAATVGSGKGEQRILAPMPGRVVRVLVKTGDLVSARQGLLVIEAMKMENELVAARPGRVTDVTVTDGTSVEAGRLLVRIE